MLEKLKSLAFVPAKESRQEFEAYIASLRDDLLGLMHMWDEQRG